ncbi:MAG TPA: hypothetical protein VJ044_08845 [Candidatus Hodarchaeales archaeon]|nr:hypothetical protein [Candidatus Hodarchaeales archaeon]
MSHTKTVSAKIPARLWEKLKANNIQISSVIRQALEAEASKIDFVAVGEQLKSVGSVIARIDPDRARNGIREDRDTR